jgi:hypothetical protein
MGRRTPLRIDAASAGHYTAQIRIFQAVQGETIMKKIALCIALCAGVLVSAASAQSYDNNQSVTIRGNGTSTVDRSSRSARTPRAPRSTTPTPNVNVSSNQSVSTSCVDGSCTVTVNGTDHGPYRGNSVSVSSSSVNGVGTTQIYVDGRLVDEF